MPWYRLSYTKKDAVRYISHLDIIRLFERVIRRAGLPVALSQGFNPRPRFSFGPPLPVGMTGLNELADVEMRDPVDPGEMVDRINRVVPAGFLVNSARPIPDNAGSPVSAVDRAVYAAVPWDDACIDQPGFLKCLHGIMEEPEIKVARKKKDGQATEIDIRPGLYMLETGEYGGRAAVIMHLSAGGRLYVRPDEVLKRIAERYGLPVQGAWEAIIRTELY